MPTQLKVVVSGTKFVLSQDQLKVDGPNYFSDAIAAHDSRFRSPQVKVSRNPELFKLVVDFLNGYAVLPKDAPLPKGMPNRKAALKNLIAEAKFYRLNSLESIVTDILQKLDVGPSWHVMLSRVSVFRFVYSPGLSLISRAMRRPRLRATGGYQPMYRGT
jgi:hypothetical protein